MADAPDPPGVAGVPVVLPVIQRVAPQLAVRGKVVRRAARHPAGMTLRVSLEQLPACPEVGRIRRHVDGNVAHDLHALFGGVGVQGAPLLVELVLQEGPEFQIGGVGGAELLQRGRLPHAQPLRPLLPVLHAVFLLDGHVQAVIRQPCVRQKAEPIPVVPVGGVVPRHGTLFQKVLIGHAQHRKALVVDGAVVHLVGVAAPVQCGVIGLFQKPVRRQQIQIDEIGVARKGGTALVGTVGVAGGGHRQNLPDALPRRRQKVHKLSGGRAERADAVAARQAGNGHQNAAAALELHNISPLTP